MTASPTPQCVRVPVGSSSFPITNTCAPPSRAASRATFCPQLRNRPLMFSNPFSHVCEHLASIRPKKCLLDCVSFQAQLMENLVCMPGHIGRVCCRASTDDATSPLARLLMPRANLSARLYGPRCVEWVVYHLPCISCTSCLYLALSADGINSSR